MGRTSPLPHPFLLAHPAAPHHHLCCRLGGGDAEDVGEHHIHRMIGVLHAEARLLEHGTGV
jgi:hypothetical protein